jgi:signal peptidase I
LAPPKAFDKARKRRLTCNERLMVNMFGRKTRPAPPFGGVHADDDIDIEVRRPGDAARGHLWAEARLLVRDLIFAFMVVALVMVFVMQPVKVEGTSMLPRLHDGERIFVNKLIYYDEYRFMPRIERGDIVVFWYPDDPSKSYIKRVIGLPGDKVEIHQGRVRVNERDLDEPYLDPELNSQRPSQPPVYVRPNYYFVMGDNRNNSYDSRNWGLVPKKYIYGKALFRYWPLSAASIISHDAHYKSVPPGSTYNPEYTPLPNRDDP